MNYETSYSPDHHRYYCYNIYQRVSGRSGKIPGSANTRTVLTTTIAAPVTTATTLQTHTLPTPTIEPFPTALKLKQPFNFSSGKTASEATVYRAWINDTYQLFDPRETRYATKHPAPGNKYLIIFVSTVNRGTASNLPVKSGNVQVRYEGMIFYSDPTHVLPKTDKNVDSPPEIFRIREIESLHKLYGSEYVEDFGYSHGNLEGYLKPGESNAIDGYIVFEVPSSLTPDTAYVEIGLNSQDSAIWKLV